MKKLSLRQGSDMWLTWRSQGLGASVAPVVLDLCPPSWKRSRLRLWEELTGRVQPDAPNFVQRRGVALEQDVRAWYEQKTGNIMQPTCVVHDRYEWLKCSLDGLDFDDTLILEIKSQINKDVHRLALAGTAVGYYYAQIQHQLLVTGLMACDYVTFNSLSFAPEDHYALVRVNADPDYQKRLFEALASFWDCVLRDVVPPDPVPTPSPKKRKTA